MSTNTKIEWTDATWNPVAGCSAISPACDHCYAQRMATRLAHNPATKHIYGGLAQRGCWTGQTRLIQSVLDKPLGWKKPRKIFVCSMGDLFHESVENDWIDQVLAVAVLANRHTFQLLTKRAARMREYFAELSENYADRLAQAAWKLGHDEAETFVANSLNNQFGNDQNVGWPLRNLWLGVTAENQEQANLRLPQLLETQAGVRFVSIEPMLGQIEVGRWLPGSWFCENCDAHHLENELDDPEENEFGGHLVCRRCGAKYDDGDLIAPEEESHPGWLDWVIVGGETGPGARHMQFNWVEKIRDDCQASGVPFFFKQWGNGHAPGALARKGRLLDDANHTPREWNEFPEVAHA